MKNMYEIKGNVTVIYINAAGEVKDVLIDTEDLEKVKESTKNTFYGHRKGNGLYPTALIGKVDGVKKYVRIHRVIMDCPEGLVVDHISGNTLDNRKSNLRICTHKENRKNINRYYNI